MYNVLHLDVSTQVTIHRSLLKPDLPPVSVFTVTNMPSCSAPNEEMNEMKINGTISQKAAFVTLTVPQH